MRSFPILLDLGLVVSAAALFLLLGRALRLPPIASYLLAGLALGPASGLLAAGDSIALFSELGVALLLFIVGLELQLARVRDLGSTALVVGCAQVALTALAGAALAGLLGFARADAVVIGLALTFSSTVVVVKLLDRAGGVASVWGRTAIGVLLVQDVVVAVVLTVLRGSGGAAVGGEAVAMGLARATLGMAALAAAAWIGARWVLSDLLGRVAAYGDALLAVSLTWAFALIVGAERVGVSIELGAFLAGIAVAQLPYADELARRVHPLADLFLGVFFVSLAAGLDLDAARAVWWPALLLSAFVLVFKPALVTALLVARAQPHRAALLSGITLGQVSEFGFVLIATASASGLLEGGGALDALMTTVGLITIGTSAALLPLLRRIQGDAGEEPGPTESAHPVGHVVVIGMNTLGRMVVERFARRGERVVAVDVDPRQLHGLPAETVFGSADHPAVLRRAGVTRAKLVVVATRLEDLNALLAYRCNRMGVPVSVHAFDPALEEELLDIGADHVIISKLDGIRLVDGELRRLGMMG
jgi:Kef-type K+ transport system membrane component KefB